MQGHKLNLAASLDVGWNDHGNLLGRYNRDLNLPRVTQLKDRHAVVAERLERHIEFVEDQAARRELLRLRRQTEDGRELDAQLVHGRLRVQPGHGVDRLAVAHRDAEFDGRHLGEGDLELRPGSPKELLCSRSGER